MGWTYDKDKVQSQWGEFKTFLGHAERDEPAGIADIFGRPFQHPSGPAITPEVHPTVEVNYYLLQLNQLYEAGVIDQHQYSTIANNIYG
jgi:hypothetical protein